MHYFFTSYHLKRDYGNGIYIKSFTHESESYLSITELEQIALSRHGLTHAAEITILCNNEVTKEHYDALSPPSTNRRCSF